MWKPRTFVCGLVALALVGCGTTEEPVALREAPRVEVPERPVFAELDRATIRLSPDGRHLAFLAPGEEGTALWLAGVDDLASARAVVEPTRIALESFQWAYSSRYLLCREVGGRLWALDVASGGFRSLSPEGLAAEWVHLSPDVPGKVVIAIAGTDGEGRDLHRVDIAGGESELLVENESFESWGVDDDLDLRLAFEPIDGGGLRVRKKAETGEWADFSWVPTQKESKTRFIAFDATALRAFFLDGRGRDTVALVESDMTSGEARLLFQDPVADVIDVLMHPAERTIQAVASAHPQRRWRVLDEAVRSDLDTLLALADGDVEIIDRSLDDQVWLAAIAPFDAPRRFYSYTRETGEAEFLFAGMPLANPAAPAAP